MQKIYSREEAERAKKKRRSIAVKIFLLIAGVVGFYMIINSLGSIDSDFITISFQVSLNVRRFFTGLTTLLVSVYVFKSIFVER